MSHLERREVADGAEAGYPHAHIGNLAGTSSTRSNMTDSKSRFRMLAVGVIAGTILTLAAPGLAQRRRISLDEIVVEGNIQKPEAFFILPRTSLNFEDLERREDLKQRIIDSVEKAPF